MGIAGIPPFAGVYASHPPAGSGAILAGKGPWAVSLFEKRGVRGMGEHRSLWYVGLTLIGITLLCKAGWGQMQTLSTGSPSLEWWYWSSYSHPSHCRGGKADGTWDVPSRAASITWRGILDGAPDIQFFMDFEGGGNMRRVLAGAKNQWVHGLPWVSFPAISLELGCCREPLWVCWGLTPRWGQSLTYLELQWDGYHAAKCIRAKECWSKGAAPMHLKGMQQEWKFCTPLSLRGKGITGASE